MLSTTGLGIALAVPQAIREASATEETAQAAEERASKAHEEIAGELRDAKEQLRGVEVW